MQSVAQPMQFFLLYVMKGDLVKIHLVSFADESSYFERHTPFFNLPVCIALCEQFFICGQFTMMIPELPGYLTSLGGADYKGYIIALFTLMAGISRPFSGKLTDTVGGFL